MGTSATLGSDEEQRDLLDYPRGMPPSHIHVVNASEAMCRLATAPLVEHFVIFELDANQDWPD